MRETLKAFVGYSLLFTTVSFAILIARGHGPLPSVTLAQAGTEIVATSSMVHDEMRRAIAFTMRH